MKSIALILLFLMATSTLTFAQEVSAEMLHTFGRTELTDADHAQIYSIMAKGNGNINKVALNGQFCYTYSNEHDAGLSMLYNPGKYTFFYTDTIRGDVRREQYNVDAGLSYPFNDNFSASLDGSVMLGSKAKQRDIRNKNVANYIYLSPAISWHKLSLSYRFSQYREEVSLKRFGPDVVIPITTSEGLFFGPTEAYGAQHTALYYRTISNGAAVSYIFNKIKTELSYLHTSSDIDTHVDERKIGREEGNRYTLYAELQDSHNTHIQFSYSSSDSYTPVGQKVSNGNREVYQYFSEVKRHNIKEIALNLNNIVSISTPEDKFVALFSYFYSNKKQTHYILPQEYSQNLISHKATGDISYTFPCRLKTGIMASVNKRKGDMLTLKNKSLEEQKYNRNANLLEKEWNYLISNRFSYGLKLAYDHNISNKGSLHTALVLNIEDAKVENKKSINLNISYKL